MIGIIDYGMGNLASVSNALKHLNQEYIISQDTQQLQACDKLILPGVGAFMDAMEHMNECQLTPFILEQVKLGKPLLGICLGMQMLFEESEEKGNCKGLGLIKGKVVEIQEDLPVPEIGWNDLQWQNASPLQAILSQDPYMYYVHSYYAVVKNQEDLIAYSMYGNTKVAGIVCHNNVLGCQFHPEKSGQEGLQILKYFAEDFI